MHSSCYLNQIGLLCSGGIFEVQCSFVMVLDDIFINLDWDPCYLESIFNQDFYEMAELWNEGYIEDSCLLEAIEKN